MNSKHVLIVSLALSAAFSSAYAETLSERSGMSGNTIVEARVNPGSMLRGLMILEEADRPCVVQIYGNLTPVDKYEDRIDQCKGGGPKKADGIDSAKGQVFISGGASYVTGLKVCLSNSERVKGWAIYGLSNNSPNAVSDSFKRPNCPEDGWQTRVNCPAGSQAIGVRAHFEEGTGDNSDKLRGMQLICS